MNFLRREKPGYNRLIKRQLLLNPLSVDWLKQKPTGKGVKFLEAHSKGLEDRVVHWKDPLLKGLSEKAGPITETKPLDIKAIEQNMVYKLAKMDEKKTLPALPTPAIQSDLPPPPSFSYTFGPYDLSILYENTDAFSEKPTLVTMEDKVLSSIMDDLMEFTQGEM